MYARIHIYEDGCHTDLLEYTVDELEIISAAISSLTGMYNIDMYYGHINDLSNAFCEKYRNPYVYHRLYPKNGWSGVKLEVTFEILYDDEGEYSDDFDDSASWS